MDANTSQFRFYVFTRQKLGTSSKDIYDELRAVWGDKAPSYPTVRRWTLEFSSGARTSFGDAPRSGRPSTSRTDEKISQVRVAIQEDSKLSTRDLSIQLGIDKTTVHTILTEELLLRHVCSVWVPHELSANHLDLRVASAKGIRKCLHSLGPAKYDRYVVLDETWVPFEPYSTKSENKVWIAPGEARPQVARPALTNKKTMLLVAFTANKRFSVQATGPNETVDSQLFIDFLRKTGDKWRTLRSDPIRLSEIQLQMDNARPHSSAATAEFLKNREVNLVWQSPYSPDLNLCDRFLFKTMKKELRKQSFHSEVEVEEAALRFLRQLSEQRLHDEVDALYDYCQDVINEGGTYVTD